MPNYMNVNLLAHIALDPELGGRYGVQGNTFKNTVGYLCQYIQSRTNVDPQLAQLTIKMGSLIDNETRICDLDSETKDEKNVDAIVDQMVNQIETSAEGADVLIPGGWGHAQEGGHALIYQFQKTATRLRFFTYNAGSGSGTHEQWSTTKNERFYPVKLYELVNPIQRDRLKKLIRQIIVPQLIRHPSRDPAGFDAGKLDMAVKRDLALLGAEAIDISKHVSRDMATTGQLSGTCSQRSIHQMLKLNFKKLSDYQRFMFDFKMHALHDFINTHQPPRAKAIAELLKLAIESNLKLLQASSAFSTEEQNTAADELILLKETIMAENAIKIPEPRTPIVQPETDYKLTVRSSQSVAHQQTTTSNTTQYVASTNTTPIPDIVCIQHNSSLLNQLDSITTQCKAMESLYPLWVLEQIEKTLLQLPLPDEDFAYYQGISSPDAVARMISHLETLQTLYLSVYQKSCGDTKSPKMYMTHWSLLALHDHFEMQQAAQQNRPTFHRYIEDQFRIVWSELRNCPTLATHHPDSDQRIQQLMHHYQSSEKLIKFTGGFFASHYLEIFNSHPKLKKKLEHLHSLKEWRYATLHREMVKNGVSALIYLSEALKTNDPTVDKQEFAPLLDAIQQQMHYEKFVSRSLHAVTDCSETTNEQFEFTWSPHDGSPHVKSSLNNRSSDGDSTHIHYGQLQYQYDQNRSTAPVIPDESMESRLRRLYEPLPHHHKSITKMNSHEIQLYAHGGNQDAQITKSDYNRREPYHLRTSLANQINLTVDDFKSAINKLEDTNNQTWLDDNLFQPGVLRDLLERDPRFVERFDGFIQTGFQAFMDEKGQLSNKSLFLIRLSTYFNRYVAELNPEIADVRLNNQQKQLSGLLEIQRDPDVLSAIHHYRFITIMARFQLNPALDQQELLTDALFSHVYLNNNPVIKTFELTQLQHTFKAWLQKMPVDSIVSSIKTILPNIGIVIPDCHIEGTYPLFTLSNPTQSHSYSIDIESGRIFKGSQQYSNSLPSWLNKPQILFQFPDLGSDHSCLVSTYGTCVELIAVAIPTRIIQTRNGISIQKKWMINGIDDWYEQQPLPIKPQKAGLPNVGPAIEHNLPACLTDNSINIWVNTSGQAILTRHDKPIYHTNHAGHLERFDNSQVLVISTDQRLLSFEDPAFFCVNVDSVSQLGTIDFVRYGLSLNMNNSRVTLPDSAYELTSTDTSPFDPMIACLNFSDGRNQKCTVAVQRAYVDPNQVNPAVGDYYPLTHDRTGYIQTKEAQSTTGVPNYENTENAITYPIVDGKPKPNNAADALYLCYLYLITHKTEDAWAVLDDLNKRFSLEGNTTELKYLAWIVNALPVKFKDEAPDANQETQLETPRYVACQLKALALLTDHMNQGKTLSSPFTKDLPSTIYRLYVQLQRMRRHLSVHYTLTDHESKSLLHYFHQDRQELHERNQDKKKPKAFTVLGALGYEWRRLTLKTLCIEYQRLQTLCKSAQASNTPLSVGVSQRLADIQIEFNKELDVISKETRLEHVPITVSAYNSSKFDFKVIPKLDDPDMSVLIEQAIAALPLPMHDLDFSKHMLIYVRIALDNNHPARKLLEERCTRFLIANDHDRSFAQDSMQLNVLRLLYSVLSNTDNLAKQCSQLTTPLKLGDLPEMIKRCPTQPPIMIYQAKNVFDTLLAGTRDIRTVVEKEIPVHVPIQTSPWTLPKPLTIAKLIQTTEEALPDKTQITLHALQVKYRAAETLEALQRKKLPKSGISDAEKEHAAGQFKYQRDQTQRKLAKSHFSDPVIREALHQNASTFHDAIDQTLTAHWHDALQLAREMSQTIPFKLESAAGLRRELTQNDLLTLYFHADQTLYQDMTGLSDSDAINKLHGLIHQSVALEVQKQHMQRLINALNQAKEHTTDSAFYQIANTLMAVNHAAANADPQLMLFQYYENILLRPRQIDALTHLLSTSDDPHAFHEAVEKIIMGGGKSKVILPLLAQKKATGTNLVIIEVPRALLATNHHDLNETSQRLFGQRAFVFDFNRDSDCSPKRLETIHQWFIDVMTDKAYLVTTGESMQSLQLKYLEMLLNRPDINHATSEQIKEWEKQVHWLGKITQLLKHRTDVIIDEVHQGLLLKKKLNYTLGNKTTLNPEFIKHSIALYEFIEKINDVTSLADALIENPDSPLQGAMQSFGASFKDELRAYLNNEYESDTIRHASMDLKNTFAFYKEQITLLPQTLSRKHKANYGPSQINQEKPALQAIAIPYMANNKPNERSRFGNPLETINYTIQSVLLDGLSAELLAELILRWQTKAREEWKINYPKYAGFNQTPTARRLQALLVNTGFTLQTIDVQNKEHIKHVLPRFKHHKPTLFEALKTQILTEIINDPEILHSDAYNHVDMYRSVQGLSGTPSNHATYHQRLQFNHETSLGTDGYIQNVLRGKHTPMHGVDFNTLPTFIHEVFSKLKHPHDLRAFIDINATFIGISNLVVAEALARFVSVNNSDIHYILYFNNENELYALDVNEPKTSIPFSQITNYKPEHCFTYYDQDHTVGIDLKQADNATGVVFIDEKTQIQSFLQGGMRMRGLENEQTLEIIMPKAMQAHTLDSMMVLMEKNERRQLAEDHFFAALGKMDNLVREHLLGLINGLDDADYTTKHQWAQAFKPFLVEKQSTSLYERYGAIYHELDTADVFAAHQARLFDQWMVCLASINKTAELKEIKSLQGCLNTIIQASLPICQPKAISHARGAYENAVEAQKEQEAMKEQQQLKEQEKFVNLQAANTRHTPCAHIPWNDERLAQFSQAQSSAISMKSLNEASASMISYSPQLMISANFTTIYREQKQMIGPYMNPVQTILFRMHNDQLTACLINNQEAEELYHLLPIENIWMTTTQHTLLAGERPDWVLNDPAYQTLIEQTRFFSGEWRSLLQQKIPFQWLNEQPQEKLEYFETNLLPFRDISIHEFDQINPMILNKIKEQTTEPIEIARNDSNTLSRIDPHVHEDTSLHVVLNDYERFVYVFKHLPADDQFNALMVKNKTGQTVLDVIIGLHTTKSSIKLPRRWYEHFSSTSSGIVTDVAVSSQNMFTYYLKNWPDTWEDGLAAKKVIMNLAERHQDLLDIIMCSVTDDVRYRLLKTIAATTNYALILELSFNEPATFKQLLYDLPQAERINMLRNKNHQGVSLLDMAADNTELFDIILDALPVWDRHKARVDEQGNNELHLAVNDIDAFLRILYLIPASDRLDAIMEKNKLDQTIVDLALDHPIIYKILSDALPELDRYGLVVDKEGNTALHCAAGNEVLFREQLLAIPESYRFQLLMKKNKQGDTVLRLAMEDPKIYEILLDALPDEERYKMFIDKDSGMTLHDLIDSSKIRNKVKIAEDNSLTGLDFGLCVQIIKSIPPKHRLYAFMIHDENAWSLMGAVKTYPRLFPLFPRAELLNLLTTRDLLEVEKDDDGNTQLHLAAKKGLDAFQTVLHTLPEEDRATALMISNNPACIMRSGSSYSYTPFSSLHLSANDSSFYAQDKYNKTELYYIDVKNESIIELPIKQEEKINAEQRLSSIPIKSRLSDDDLKTITSLTGHTHKKTALELALESGITLPDILNILPESDRQKVAFSAMKIKLKEGKILLDIASEEGLSAFQSLIRLLAPQDRLAALLLSTPEKYSDKDVSVFERVCRNKILFAEVINELPECDHVNAVRSMLDCSVYHPHYGTILCQAAGDINTTRLIVNAIPKERLQKYLTTSDENGSNFLLMNIYSTKNMSDFCKMIKEILPCDILLDVLNNISPRCGWTTMLSACQSIESFSAVLSLYPINKRHDVILTEEIYYIFQRFHLDGLKVMLEALPVNHQLDVLGVFIQIKEQSQHTSDLNDVKVILREFTDSLKQALPETSKLEMAMIKQTIIMACTFVDLKEPLEKLKTLMINSQHSMDNANSDAHEINLNEPTASVKERFGQLHIKFFQQHGHSLITKPQKESEIAISALAELATTVSQIIESYKQLESAIQTCENYSHDNAVTSIKMIDDITEIASKLRQDLYEANEAQEGISSTQKEPIKNMDSLKSFIKIAQDLGDELAARVDQMMEKLEQSNANTTKK